MELTVSQSKYTLQMKKGSPLGNSTTPKASTYLDFIQNQANNTNSVDPQMLFDTDDEKMKRIRDIIVQTSNTSVPVLITGESGVGKEVIARAIHKASSTTKQEPFIAINCAAVPPSLLESELFGFEKGSFTGADQKHIGKFELANNGTILLDEITEIDVGLQAKLLRVIQEKEIDKIGGKRPVPINTRIVATTNKDILTAVQQGKFREDLYYRLYVLQIEVPPLRDRPKDIVHLANKFLKQFGESINNQSLRFSEEALDKIKRHKWPGNVRELQNVIQRATILAKDNLITNDIIPIEDTLQPKTRDWIEELPLGEPLRLVETHFILETLKHHNGNRTHAAKTLGISLRTLRNKINEFSAMGYEIMGPFNGRS